MKTLNSCIKKFGKMISPSDAEQMKADRQEYIDAGMGGEQATFKAVSDWSDRLAGHLQDIEKEIVDAGGHIDQTSYSTNDSKASGKNSETWKVADRENGMPFYFGDGYFLKPVIRLRTKDDFSEEKRALDWGHAIQVDKGMEAWAIDIILPDGSVGGLLTVQVDPKTDDITAIHDIHIEKENRGGGLGSKIVRQIIANSEKPVKIIQMIDSAWDFWQKMGVDYRDPNTHSGELGWQAYDRSRKNPVKIENKASVEKPKENTDVQENDENVEEYDLNKKQDKGEEDNWLYRVDESDPFSAPPKDTFIEKAIRYIQNKFLPLKRVQEAILNAGAIITDEMNAYVKEELMHEKSALELEKMQDKYVSKIVEKLASSDITQEELDTFLYAKHARERNAFIAERNEDIPEGGSGMSDSQAVDILREFENFGKTNDLNELSEIVYAMLKDKNARLNEAGTLSDAQKQSWEESFEFYVPLKGFQEDGGETETAYVGKVGKGFNINGNESMRSLGRRSMSASPLVTAIQDSTSAILRAEKNKVSQAFLKMVKANPNPDYWTIHTQNNPGTRQQLNPKTNKVENMPLSFWDMGKDKEHFLGVKVAGEQIYIKMTDVRLAKAMNNLGDDATNGVIQLMAKGTRMLSALNTSLNPEFMISNMARDIQTAIYNALAETDRTGGKLLSVENKKSFVGRMANPKQIFSAMRAISRAIKNHDASGEWENHWREFREQGGKTGYFDMKTPDQIAHEMENLLKIAKGGFEGGFRKKSKDLFEAVDRINTAVENAVRLSAYVESQKPIEQGGAGLSKQQSASLAKNLTVNFNRKGEITWLNAIYMFGNASVQGTAQFLRSIVANPKNHPSGKTKLTLAQKAAVTMSSAGYLFALMGRELGGEDEDGEKWIDKVPDYVTERNLVIMKSILGGKEDGSYWSIPLPYGYNVFHNVGTALESVANGGKRKNIAWASRFLTFSALGSFSPVGMTESKKGLDVALVKTATPTLFKPFAEMAVDENFFGSHIYRNSTFDKNTVPDSRGKLNTGDHWKAVSKFLNEISGGSHFKSGAIDIAPESFKHLLNSYAGGLGRLGDNLVTLTGNLASGNKIESRKIPFYRKVSGKVSEYSNITDFYERKDEVGQTHDEFNSLKGKDKIIFRRENKNLLSLYSLGRSTEKRLRALRRRKKLIEASKSTNKKEILETLEKKMNDAVTRFNKQYNSLFN